MEVRTDRLGVLIDQFSESVSLSRGRIDGMDDGEYLWEPVPSMFSIRRRSEVRTPDAYGPGEWVIDHDRTHEPFAPAPPGTIAWRIGHLTSGFAGRWEWTYGERATDPRLLVDFTPHAAAALEELWSWTDRWAESAETLTAEQLDVPGFGGYPYGLDPQLPFIGILWWVNRELIHHLAEVALLRDLYAQCAASGGVGSVEV